MKWLSKIFKRCKPKPELVEIPPPQPAPGPSNLFYLSRQIENKRRIRQLSDANLQLLVNSCLKWSSSSKYDSFRDKSAREALVETVLEYATDRQKNLVKEYITAFYVAKELEMR